MNKQQFTNLLQNSLSISNEQLMALEKVAKQHPYFQGAKALHLKGLKDHNNYKYNKVLKETAALTTDRTVLFEYISGFTKSIKTENPPITDETKEQMSPSVSEQLNVGAPLEFNKNEAHSFTEWLQLSKLEPISRSANKNSESTLNKNEDLIERFIDQNPSIQPVKKEKMADQTTVYPAENARFMTETLARVYLEQKKYDNAIKAYQILILKYPEKSGFFADQIKQNRTI